ncbi:MAG: PQQ-dependent sugar dehydrogenase, partial [Actinomycetota bacterium]|nr:PQQ-dependent sugar dehydrogenase [Actinomycetota bacterium]
VLLVRPGCVPAAVRAELQRLTPERLVILGGPAAVSEAVERLTPCAGPREVSVIATGLQAPWDIVFVPGGRAYLTERDTGRLLVREPDGAVREVQRFEVDNDGEGGLLGLAASPGFAQDGLLYAFMTTASDNRLLRFRPGEPGQPILTGLPAASYHDAGRIDFGPDGMLYVTTGDAGVPSRSQDPGSLAGKVLRLTADGGVPPDNPLPGSPVYALGLRDPQGLAWDAAGRLYATEFGPDRDDEVNLIVPGGNYGWPEVTGAAGDPRFVDPLVVRQPREASWSGAAILLDGAVPEWEGSLFAAGLRGQRLWRFPLDDQGRVTGAEELLVGQFGRLRQVVQALDGSLWILTSNRDGRGDPVATDDRIVRIGPPPG